MWSGPRNISTAMMRSWENRPDTSVVDEPFYAFYLANTQSPHPCTEAVLASQPQKYTEVVRQLTDAHCKTDLHYQKHMTHHMLPGVDLLWTKHLLHCFLIREPKQVVLSYSKKRETCTVEDIGIIRQWELYQEISEITGQAIPVIDSNEVQTYPELILSKLCTLLNISFYPEMLAWPRGLRASDGVWASHWYQSVSESTGFTAYQEKELQLTDEQMRVVQAVEPYYLKLSQLRIKP
jgi:hypothetical protein